MPVLGLERSVFTIPKTKRLSVPLRDAFVLDVVDCSLPSKQKRKKMT